MDRKTPIPKFARILNEYPRNFWILAGASFIDTLGGALIFPFFSLYITGKFNVGMVKAGALFTIFAVSGMIGGLIGGAMTDRFGRRAMIIFGLISSAITALGMGLVQELRLFYSLAAIAGLMSSTGRPAQQAMVADILGEDKRIEGFGIIRVAINLAFTVGPAIGGLLAGVSYLSLFIIDAAASMVAAIIVVATLPETRPEHVDDRAEESLLETFKGYRMAVQDNLFLAFIILSILMGIVYLQMNSTLPVYLRDVHNIAPQNYGYLISLNAGMVVLFQFWVTRRISGRPPMLLMSVGTLLYGVGVAMFGFTSAYFFFFLAIIIITTGEMIVAPTGQALVAQLAPQEMRGRYMAAYSFAHVVPVAIGPLLAGLIMDTMKPNFVWYAGGLLGLVAALGFAWLQKTAVARLDMGPKEANLT